MGLDLAIVRNVERAHYLMQLSAYFSELTDIAGVRFAYTNKLDDVWYNQAYDINFDGTRVDDLIETVESYFSRRDRRPCLYTSPTSKPAELTDLLQAKGYGKFDDEAWMFYDFSLRDNRPLHRDISISEVRDEIDVAMFAEIYREGLPGPAIESYIDAAIEGLRYRPPLVSISYFTCTYQERPAGIACLHRIGHYAGLYAVATIPAFQQKGVARALINHISQLAKHEDVKFLFLQTGAGEESEQIFEKLGFKTRFIREGFTRNDTISTLQHG